MFLWTLLKNQTGAMFGLDGRIAMAIFGGLSVIAGVTAFSSLNTINAQAFAKEIRETATAIEGIHSDLKQDLHRSLLVPSDKNAYMALFDRNQLENRLRSRWLGPYVQRNTDIHPKYGFIRITKARRDRHTDSCLTKDNCALWLTYDMVPPAVATALNDVFDGDEENPDVEGKLQFDLPQNEVVKVWYRVSGVLSLN